MAELYPGEKYLAREATVRIGAAILCKYRFAKRIIDLFNFVRRARVVAIEIRLDRQ